MYKIITKILSKTPLKRSKLLLSMDTRIRGKLKPDFVITKENHKIYLDPNDCLRLSLNVEGDRGDKFEMDTIREHVKEGDVVVDIGGHIGFYTLMLSSLVGETGKVYTFEPNPDNFALLKKNIEVNEIKNVVLINKAVSNIAGEVQLNINPDNSGGHSINVLDNSFDSVIVDTVVLDDYFDDSIKINFIKIDAEGHEGKIFKGMERILKTASIKVLTELSNESIGITNDNKRIFFNSLEGLGFEFFSLDYKKQELQKVDSELFLEDGYVKNILMVK